MIRVINRSAAVVSTMVVPATGNVVPRLVIVPGMTTATPTKHIPINEANEQTVALLA
jgi:hypothetical protein